MGKKNYIIGLVAFSKSYIDSAMHLIYAINQFIDVDFVVLTDLPESFKNIKNVRTLKYESDTFSYHSKIEVFKDGFQTHDSVLFLDVDHYLNFSCLHYFKDFDSADLKPGIYPSRVFEYPHPASFERFCAGIKGGALGDFGPMLVDFCEKESINYSGSSFILEQIFLIKKHDKMDIFFKTWDKLRVFCEQLDHKIGKSRVGAAEGYSIGIAANHSEMELLHTFEAASSFLAFQHFTLTM